MFRMYVDCQKSMEKIDDPNKPIVHKVVLTGGACGGKTTGQARLSTFFENLGWKVYRVPEAACLLLSGGVKFADLNEEASIKFQENLLKTMLQIEETFFMLAKSCNKNCLVICDRGTMDPSVFVRPDQWEKVLKDNNWNLIELRDNRYNHVVHMVSSAIGAEEFYTTQDHTCRSESIELAAELDKKTKRAWIGHPYFDVIDNSTDFDTKLRKLIECVCQKIGINTGDRLALNARKCKFLIRSPIESDLLFPPFQDFDVVHDYLQCDSRKLQARLRRRGQHGSWSYTLTIRRPEHHGQVVEVKNQITKRDYYNMLSQRSQHHFTIFKTRRCFLYADQYFQLDIYQEPCHPRCCGLILLETYTTLSTELLRERLPPFLTIQKEVTRDPHYSMYNLSLKEGWTNNRKFCHRLTEEEHDVVPPSSDAESRIVNGF